MRSPHSPVSADHSEPIGRTARSLPAMVAERLARAILDGEVQPGARLTEISLAESHAVSRATIREAFTLLEQQHLVRRIPRYGAQVVEEFTEDEFEEVSEIRGVLLGLAARRAASTPNAPAATEFGACVAAIEALAARKSTSPQAFGKLVIEAQDRLLALAGSGWTAKLYDQLSHLTRWNVMIRRRAFSFSTAERRAESARGWRGILDALQGRDAEGAEAFARRLLEDTARFVRGELEKDREKVTKATTPSRQSAK